MQTDELTITSMEAAKLMEKDHGRLLSDIRRYQSQLAETEIDAKTFFAKAEYIDDRGKEREFYKITRKGCELLAYKLAGARATVFAARYISRFHELSEGLKAEWEISGSQAKGNTFCLNITIHGI